MRCTKCQKLPLKLFLEPCSVKHSESYNDLKQSAVAGCDLCTLLLRYIEDTLEGRTTEYGNSVRKLDRGISIVHNAYGSTRSVEVNWGNKDPCHPELVFHSPQLPPKGKF